MLEIRVKPAEVFAMKAVLAALVGTISYFADEPEALKRQLREYAVTGIASADFADGRIELEAFRSAIVAEIESFFALINVGPRSPQ